MNMHAEYKKSLFIHFILGSILGSSGFGLNSSYTAFIHFTTEGSHYCDATPKFEKACTAG